MDYAISTYKKFYLLFGVVGIGMLFVPVIDTGTMRLTMLSYEGTFEVIIFGTFIYPLLIVPLNALYSRFYSSEYYDKVFAGIAYIFPILVIIGLIGFTNHFGDLASDTIVVLPYIFIVLGYIVAFHGFNIYITTKEVI